MSLIDNLPHTATHTRPSYHQDDLGASLETPVTVAAGISCWVQNANMKDIERYQKQDTEISHKVFFSADPDVRPGDTLTITAGPSFVGKQLDFRAGATDRSAGLSVLFAAMFQESNNPRRT